MGHAIQDYPKKRGLVKSSHQLWPTGEGNGNQFQYSCLENPMGNTKRQNNMTLEDECTGQKLSNSLLGKSRKMKVKVASQSCRNFVTP